MRQAFILTVAAGFVGVVWTLLRQPAGRVPWMVTAYFVSHAIFVLGIYWASGRAEGNTRAYFETYQRLSLVPTLLALLIAEVYALNHDAMGFIRGVGILLVLGLFAQQLGLVAKAYLKLTELPWPILWNFIVATAFTSCSAIAFFSLATTEGDIESHLRLALAGFWFVFGAWHFAFAIGKLNPHLGWITRQDWIPTFAIFVTCLWISYKLNTHQAELGYQSLPEIEFRERVAAPEIEMAARSQENVDALHVR